MTFRILSHRYLLFILLPVLVTVGICLCTPFVYDLCLVSHYWILDLLNVIIIRMISERAGIPMTRPTTASSAAPGPWGQYGYAQPGELNVFCVAGSCESALLALRFASKGTGTGGLMATER